MKLKNMILVIMILILGIIFWTGLFKFFSTNDSTSETSETVSTTTIHEITKKVDSFAGTEILFDERDSFITIEMPKEWRWKVVKTSTEYEIRNDITIDTGVGAEISISLGDFYNTNYGDSLENTGNVVACEHKFNFVEVGNIGGDSLYRKNVFVEKSYVEDEFSDVLYSQCDHYMCDKPCREDIEKVGFVFSLGDIEDVLIVYNIDYLEIPSNSIEKILSLMDASIASINIK